MSTPERSILDLMRAEGRKTPKILLRALDGDVDVAGTAGKQRYELMDQIAQGGIGVIWRARDVDLCRHAAIKVLRDAYGQSPETIERFVEEAQIGGQLQHPGIVPVYGLGVLEDFRPYFAMKLVKGRTLAEVLAERKSPADGRRRLLSFFERICQTVAYAHARGVVHRDLKPRNIMIGAFEEVQVVDWGFAKVLAQGGVADERRAQGKPDVTRIATVRSQSEDSESVSGSVMGTIAYMPPEQAMGMVEDLDERSDVFSLGAILCEILTGEPPYTRERGDLLDQAIHARLDAAKAALDASDADEELTTLAKHCLEPLRADRPRTAQVLAQSMTSYLTSVEDRAHRAELAAIHARSEAADTREQAERAALERLAGRRARRQTVALSAALVVLVVGAAATFFWMRHDRATREREALSAIDEALREGRYHEGRAEWVEAIAAAQRSLDLAVAAAADGTTQERARYQLSLYEDERRRADEDRAMVERLDSLRSRWSNGDNHRATDRDFATAFREYGYDVDVGDPQEIGVRLGQRRIAEELAAALDDWWLLRRASSKLRSLDWKRLIDIARAADPDELRNKVRDATAARDMQALRSLAATEGMPAQTVLLLGHGMVVADGPEHGIGVLRGALLRFPRNPWMHARLAYAADMMKDRQASVRYFSAAVALRPNNAQMSLQLGDALVLTRQSGAAIPAYRRAVELGPEIVRAYVGLGLALYDQKDYRGTVKVCEDAMRNAPPDPLPPYVMATAYDQLGEHDAAIMAIEKAAELGPDHVMVHREMGDIYFRVKRYADATPAYARALKIKPNDFTAWSRKGSCHQSLQQYDEALHAFHEAQKLMPDHPDANLWIARIHWLRHEWALALPWLERAHRLGTRAGNWRYPTARFIVQAKAWQDVQPRLPQLLSGDEQPRDAKEHRVIAELFYETRQYAESTRFYKELFDAHPEQEVFTSRYGAACAAALANDAESRALALRWLERALADLRGWPKATIQQWATHWKRDNDLVSVRDKIADLPEPERAAWQKLWRDLDALVAEQADK